MSRRFDFQFSLARLFVSTALIGVSLVLFQFGASTSDTTTCLVALFCGTLTVSGALTNLVDRAVTGIAGATVIWAYFAGLYLLALLFLWVLGLL
jgi:hypothetical protein